MPIPASLGVAGLAAITELGRASPEVLIQRMFYGLDSFLILAVPLFILLGDLMVATRITDRLVDFAMALVGRLRGGLGHVSILANMLISGISGSGTADAAATGAVLIPAMERAGYKRPLAAAIIGASATAGPIIPPSVFMIIYASLAGESVARMFIAGLAPGVIMGVAMMILVAWMARRYGMPRGEKVPLREIPLKIRRALLVLAMPIIVIGGILGGVFTATESAAVAVIYTLIVGCLVLRNLSLKTLISIFKESALTTGKVMFVLATASAFSWILARAGAPQQLAALPFFAEGSSALVVLLGLNIILLILGTLMEGIAILLIIAPMILPIADAVGIDRVHLGVIMCFNLSIGLVTPPFGSIMFVVCAIGKVSIYEFTRAVWPFVVVLIGVLILITYVPATVLWVPDLLMGPSN
jgi:C4-dicarboxylate transporter DctM subunit